MKEGVVYSDDERTRLSYTLADDGTFHVDIFATNVGTVARSTTSQDTGNTWVNLRGKVEDR